MEFIIEKDSVYVFKDANGNTYKVGKEVGTKEQALELILNPPPTPAPTYKQLREQAYAEQGLTPEYFALCLIQKELDADSKMLDDYKAKRQAIKTLYPKSK